MLTHYHKALALVGAFSVIVKTDGSFAALVYFHGWLDSAALLSSWPEYRVTHLQSPPAPGQSMTWEAAIFITIKVVSFCDADFDPATKMWTLHPLQRISVAEQRVIFIKHSLSWNIIAIYWHYAFKSTPNIGKDSQHQTLPQMCPIKQEFINKLKTLTIK